MIIKMLYVHRKGFTDNSVFYNNISLIIILYDRFIFCVHLFFSSFEMLFRAVNATEYRKNDV